MSLGRRKENKGNKTLHANMDIDGRDVDSSVDVLGKDKFSFKLKAEGLDECDTKALVDMMHAELEEGFKTVTVNEEKHDKDSMEVEFILEGTK